MQNNHEIWQRCPEHGWYDARQHGMQCPDCTTMNKQKKTSTPRATRPARQLMYDADDMRCPITGIKYGMASPGKPLAVKIVKIPKSKR
jgi:hypothetical protein